MLNRQIAENKSHAHDFIPQKSNHFYLEKQKNPQQINTSLNPQMDTQYVTRTVKNREPHTVSVDILSNWSNYTR